MRGLAAWLLWLSLTSLSWAAPPDSDDAAIQALAARLVEIASPKPGISKEGNELSTKLATYDHRKVLDAVLPLLDSKKPGLPDYASYVILDSKDALTPADLPALKRGYRNGGGWLPNAIAAIGSDQAIEFIVQLFREDPSSQGQIDFSLIRQGRRAVPLLMDAFAQADPGKEEKFFDGVRYIFKEMDGQAECAIPRLMEIALSDKAATPLRQQAIRTIGVTGPQAETAFPALRGLAQKQPELFAEAVSRAITSSPTASGARELAAKIDSGAPGRNDSYVIRQIGMIGPTAAAVGPHVLRWVDDRGDEESRLVAVYTLGAIGYQPGRARLEELLVSRKDWRFAFAATKALALMGATESIPALERASQEHWFPIVRDAAANAVAVLKGQAELDQNSTEAGNFFGFHFVDRSGLTLKAEEIPGLAPRRDSAHRVEPFAAFMKRAPKQAEAFLTLGNPQIRDTWVQMADLHTLPTPAGLYLGSTCGEWGGSLQFVPKQGEQVVVTPGNVRGIEPWRNEVIVASGASHLGANAGQLAKIETGSDGVPREVPWFELPGAPFNLWTTTKDELVVECRGGTMVFSDFDTFRYYGKDETEKP